MRRIVTRKDDVARACADIETFLLCEPVGLNVDLARATDIDDPHFAALKQEVGAGHAGNVVRRLNRS
jgi:hypothetical protein